MLVRKAVETKKLREVLELRYSSLEKVDASHS